MNTLPEENENWFDVEFIKIIDCNFWSRLIDSYSIISSFSWFGTRNETRGNRLKFRTGTDKRIDIICIKNTR